VYHEADVTGNTKVTIEDSIFVRSSVGAALADDTPEDDDGATVNVEGGAIALTGPADIAIVNSEFVDCSGTPRLAVYHIPLQNSSDMLLPVSFSRLLQMTVLRLCLHMPLYTVFVYGHDGTGPYKYLIDSIEFSQLHSAFWLGATDARNRVKVSHASDALLLLLLLFGLQLAVTICIQGTAAASLPGLAL
jgi:hypothetical protein